MGGSGKLVGRKLVVLSGRAKGTTFVLTKSKVNAGRERDNTICLNGKGVSRHHAVLVRDDGEYTLRDVSPRLGILLNGRSTKEAGLKLGDCIRIGEFELSYQATTTSASHPPPATTLSKLDELEILRGQLAAAQRESEDARALAKHTAAELAQARADAERSANEFQEERIAALTQEIERLVGKANLANKALGSASAFSRAQADAAQAVLAERIASLSEENAAWADRNGMLQAKISELEELAAEVGRLESELATARTVVQHLSEELTKARRTTKLDAMMEQVDRLLQLNPAERDGELGHLQTTLTEARAEWARIGELHDQIEQLAVENHGLQVDLAKVQQEAALARRCLSDETNEKFERIRRSWMAKRNEKPDKLSRFLRPFRGTPGPERTV